MPRQTPTERSIARTRQRKGQFLSALPVLDSSIAMPRTGLRQSRRPLLSLRRVSSIFDQERYGEAAFAAIEDATINSRPFRLDACQRHPRLALRAKTLLRGHGLRNRTLMKFRHIA